MKPEIQEFAKRLVELVRDRSIESNDNTLRPAAQHGVAARWSAASQKSPEEFARVLIPDIVDDTVFYLLNAIDNGEIRLLYTAENGKVIDLTKDGIGELAGWYIGSDGWRQDYSRQRHAVFGG
jgi:hypothetical protein